MASQIVRGSFWYVKQTYASRRRPPSASVSSGSRGMAFDLDIYERFTEPMPSNSGITKYSLEELIQTELQGSDSTNYGLVKTWLEGNIINSNDARPNERYNLRRSRKVLVVVENEIGCFKNLPALDTSTCKKPDLAIYNADKTQLLVQIEVESNNNQDATIKKLQLGLVDQLRYQRNIDTSITTCTGFFFPYRAKSCAAEVKIEWNDHRFKFEIDRHPLGQAEVIEKIQSAVDGELRKGITSSPDHFLALPLSIEFIQKEFGGHTKQIPSGLSVVITNNSDGMVYKHPLASAARVKVMMMKMVFKLNLTRSILPENVEQHGETLFFTYPLYDPPLPLDEARYKVATLVKSVYEALNELHLQGWAHCDVMLDNICFKEDQRKAMLIDLERAEMITTRTGVVMDKYGKSIMYHWPDGDNRRTVDCLDWRQLGIMICYILSPPQDYHSDEPRVHHPFLKSLLDKGIYDEELYESWATGSD